MKHAWLPRLLLTTGVILTLCAMLLNLADHYGTSFRIFWLALLCFCLLPVAVFGAARRERLVSHRAAAGLCINCGYDIRATPDRCPECGFVPEVTM